MIKTKDISIEKVVDCHLDVYPDSLYSKLGREFLIKTFLWYQKNPEKRKLLAYEQNDIVSGFLTMRLIGDKDSFFHYIFSTFIYSIIKFPKAVINKKFISKIFSKNIIKNKSVVNSSSTELMSLGVRTQNRNEGIATKLINEFERIAKSYSSKTLILSVRKDNSNAIGFYLKHGWGINHESDIEFIVLRKDI